MIANPDLQNYITRSRQQGMTDDQIRQNLVGQGWKVAEINNVLGLKLSNALSIVRKIIYGILWIPYLILLRLYYIVVFESHGDRLGWLIMMAVTSGLVILSILQMLLTGGVVRKVHMWLMISFVLSIVIVTVLGFNN